MTRWGRRRPLAILSLVGAIWVITPHDKPGIVYAATLTVIMVGGTIHRHRPPRRRQLRA